MPIREFGCYECRLKTEFYHPSIDPTKVPVPECPKCDALMELMISIPNIDTSDKFHSFDYQGPDGRQWRIDNLHKLRQVEHEYTKTGHNVRFDAYSAEPSNPDPVDGFGLEHWDGDSKSTSGKIFTKM